MFLSVDICLCWVGLPCFGAVTLSGSQASVVAVESLVENAGQKVAGKSRNGLGEKAERGYWKEPRGLGSHLYKFPGKEVWCKEKIL